MAGARCHWTEAEYNILRAAWPDREKLRRLLPHRSRKSILEAASRCGIRRALHIWTAAQDKKLRHLVRSGIPRSEIASLLGLGRMQVQNRLNYTGVTAGRQPYRPTGYPLVDAIRQRAFAMNMTLVDLDRVCRTGQAFQHANASRPLAPRHALKAIKVLGGRLDVEWQPIG